MSLLPQQLNVDEIFVRSWSVKQPTFYGLNISDNTLDDLLEVRNNLKRGDFQSVNPLLCRVLAAFYGSKGAKVPLIMPTVSGCVRPDFVEKNPWMNPGSASCYDGGCYLYHARAVPAKKGHASRISAHTLPDKSVLAAAKVAQTFDVAIRDNQTSDGSLSMALVKPGMQESQLLKNLRVLMENGYSDVKYLCISSAYVQVPSSTLKVLSEFPQLVINLTVSGWHSIEENLLRLNEFERYLSVLDNTYLRVVNREDWAGIGSAVSDSGARSEEWLLGEIDRRGLSSKVIRTPFHSVHKFPGSSPGNLGSRHMADISYNETAWNDIFDAGGRECCVTGKCKSCTTRCGAPGELWAPDWEIVSQAYLAMYHFELNRQSTFGRSPLAIYTARLIARKAMIAFEQSGNLEKTNYCKTQYEQLNDELSGMSLTQIQRRRFANDSHAIVMDGVDRHSLWGNAKAI